MPTGVSGGGGIEREGYKGRGDEVVCLRCGCSISVSIKTRVIKHHTL